jgi:small subunit ribosomal protein S17
MANNRKRLIGRVVSDKMEKTVVVQLEISKMHRLYKKVVRTTKKVYAHDESNAIPVGSTVRIVESKPYSKTKRWVVEEVLQQSENLIVPPSVAAEIVPSTDENDAPAAEGQEEASE